jgi:hypothetical protein
MFEKAQRVQRYFKVALYGGWKVGKTRAALSFPRPAVIDTHRGTDLYDQEYDFRREYCNRWRDIGQKIDWIRKNAAKEKIATLVIDDISVIYDDLINEVSEWRINKSGSSAQLSQGDWGVIKRRWKGFLNLLIELDVHVVLVCREKEEYVEMTDREGREVRKRSGNQLLDADRQTAYLFDFILYLYKEDNKTKKSSKHYVRVEGTRHEKLPLYSVHDITGKLLYPSIFKEIENVVMEGEPRGIPEMSSYVENIRDIKEKFGIPVIRDDDPEASPEDLKVLFARASKMTWPDDTAKCRKQSCSVKLHKHPAFTSEDGKMLIRGAYNVESTRELRKPQVEFLYGEFGKVLAGLAYLARDEKGIPYIATPFGVEEEEVKARVEGDFSAQ